jgi:phosphate acyltransferase
LTSAHIVLDGLGGSFIEADAPGAILRFLSLFPDDHLTIVTRTDHFESLLGKLRESQRVRLKHLDCHERVNFDESPVSALKAKPSSSINLGMGFLKDGGADALLSFGHTGAAVVSAQMTLGLLDGVKRAGLCALLPGIKGVTQLLDVGANVNARPEHLLQYGLMADTFGKTVLGQSKPRIGLLNVGEEENKGNERLKQANEFFQQSELNYLGNVEGNQLFDDSVDAVICNGLEGNMILKSCESLAGMMVSSLRQSLEEKDDFSDENLHTVIGTLEDRVDPSKTGACPLLGVRGNVLIGHGNSRKTAIFHALVNARKQVLTGLQSSLGPRLSAT